ncbi:GNAT family N-acetyltransferase [Salipiger mangrovisoli]|uniref:GNAT family N-acetyltransferase n=1 Tax=Salipiger mangrovisoli TaxID=2865933 RepID=A0ABR9X197_9RHOB|nr:GNAT family N-acetyltransferase [Salipiger mangrovisoli]MBE9637330.1 GNAT family N-acetyltransferase [Salipiger mangrovisoli]
MIIRPAKPSDLAALRALYTAFFREDGIATPPPAIAGNLSVMLGDPRACIFVADTGSELAGMSSGSLTFGVEFGWSAELEDLYVSPGHRGLGWSRLLVAAVLDWAHDRGARETVLVITPQAEQDQALTRFYRKFGFQASRRITMYRGGTGSGA